MCDICQQDPCVHGCPNEPEPPVFDYCDRCKKTIRIGDEYVDLYPETYCMDCATVKIAEVEDE